MKPLKILLLVCVLVLPQRLLAKTIPAGPNIHIKERSSFIHITGKEFNTPRLVWRHKEFTGTINFNPIKKNAWRVSTETFCPASPCSYKIVDEGIDTPWQELKLIGKKSNKLRFVVYGDNRVGLGDNQVHERLLTLIDKDDVDLVIHTGDMVDDGNYAPYWLRFLNTIKPLSQSIPFQPVIGNHDKSATNKFGQIFPLGTGKQNFYWFGYGPANFIVLDYNASLRPESKQFEFAKNTLQKLAGKGPLFVMIHAPVFSFSTHGGNHLLQKHYIPLFKKYGVTAVFSGHDHGYQRIGPIDHILYIVSAGGGAPLYKIKSQPAVLQKNHVLYHYCLIEIDGDKITGRVVNTMGVVEDFFKIKYFGE